MNIRKATHYDCRRLAVWNHQLIEDEGHRNPMSVTELETRMKQWIAREFTALLFYDDDRPLAYALFKETQKEIYLRHFFVDRRHRRKGIGREAIRRLISDVWPPEKRLVVEVLWNNRAGISFWKAVGYTEYSVALEICRDQ